MGTVAVVLSSLVQMASVTGDTGVSHLSVKVLSWDILSGGQKS